MPIKVMDQGPPSPFSLHSEASSLLFEELPVANEKRVGFWKSDPVFDHDLMERGKGVRKVTLPVQPAASKRAPLESNDSDDNLSDPLGLMFLQPIILFSLLIVGVLYIVANFI